MKNLNELIGVPILAGKPYYFGGYPAEARSVFIHGVSLMDIYYKKASTDTFFGQLEFEVISNFLAYYLHAPCWEQNRQLQELQADSLQIQNWNDFANVLSLAFDCGIDPF